jgi:hypothetical protein
MAASTIPGMINLFSGAPLRSKNNCVSTDHVACPVERTPAIIGPMTSQISLQHS